MRTKCIKPFLTLAACFLLSGHCALAQAEDGKKILPSPPWTAHSKNFFMLMMSLKAEDVQKLLPAGIEPSANKEGMVNAIFEMYDADRVSGMPDYKIAFIVVDIKNQDSRDGTPGHFAIWGITDSADSLEVLRSHFGFPYEHAENITIGMEQNAHTGSIGAPGKEVLRVKIEPIPEQTFTGEGIVNMVGVTGDRKIVKSEVPYLTRGFAGKVVAFEVQPQGDPVLELVKNAVPQWAMVSDNQIFSYSPAIPSN